MSRTLLIGVALLCGSMTRAVEDREDPIEIKFLAMKARFLNFEDHIQAVEYNQFYLIEVIKADPVLCAKLIIQFEQDRKRAYAQFFAQLNSGNYRG